ncbi:MAG: hypothetical protein P4L67_02235 [Candidatus Pacebacteria bacterium]|nr:hypothetical protein [Candidatus Paceibacterota bacterium]
MTSGASFESMEKLMQKDSRYHLKDHTFLEFWTNGRGEIEEHIYSRQKVGQEYFYVLSLAVWRNCDTHNPQQKFSPAKLVLEILSESREKVEAAGGSFVMNFTFGLWTLPILGIVFATFAFIVCKVKSFREIFVFPAGKVEKLD